MDDNHNNNTNTPPTPSTTNEDKNNDGYGQKAPKWGRQSSRKSARIAEKMLLSPPKKKPPIKVNKGMEEEKGSPQQKNLKDAKDGSYRNCLVCGENNDACGKYYGIQVCTCCKQFFQRIVESGSDKTTKFKCSQGSGNCFFRKETRASCHFCRFHACLKAGMDRQKIVELKTKREKKKKNANKRDYSKKPGLLDIICETFKAFHLHRRSTEGRIKLDELKKTLCRFIASIFEDRKVEIGEEQCEALVERGFASFLVIRHVFLDDLPTLKEYCSWNWNNQKDKDEPKADNGEKQQMDLLMQKVDKFRRGLNAEFLEAEEQAVLAALALSYPKFVESDEIKKVHAQLMDCLYAQAFARNPDKFNYNAYNTMKRNLEELLK